MTVLAELHQRARTDPKSLTKKEWDAIHKDAFNVPKKDFNDETKSPETKKKKGEWW